MRTMRKNVILCDSGVLDLLSSLQRLVRIRLWKPERFGCRLFILICPAVDQFFVHSVNALCCGDKVQLVSPLIIYLQNLELKIWYNMDNAALFLPSI